MFNNQTNRIRRILTLGDLAIYLLTTFIVSIFVGSLSMHSIRSIVETFLPFALVWMVVAPFAGLFRATIALDRRQLWRVGAVALFCTPVSAWLGVVWIGIAFSTDFTIVLTLIALSGMVAWRYALIRWGQHGLLKENS